MATLPLDIEREIFEFFARSADKPKELLNIALVAHRTKEWTYPYLYKVMMLAGLEERFWYPPHQVWNGSKCSSTDLKFANQVKHLMLQGITSEHAFHILDACENVEDLALWRISGNLEVLWPVMAKLPIRRISVDLEDLLFPAVKASITNLPFSKLPLDPSLFSHLTHLDISCMTNSSWDYWQPLTLLPRLTHLALDAYSEPLVQEVLRNCLRLQMLLLFTSPDSGLWRTEDLGEDHRVVLMPITLADNLSDWESGVWTGDTLWTRAEVARREKTGQHILS